MLHNLIDNYKQLQKTAITNYKLADRYYQDSDSEHPHKNAYVLAKQYNKFSRLDISESQAINHCCRFFRDALNQIECADNTLALIPDECLPAFISFHDDLIEFKHSFDRLKDDKTSNEISLCALLEQHITFLYDNGFQYQQLHKKIELAQHVINHCEWEQHNTQISIQKILKIEKYFYSFKSTSNPSMKNQSLVQYLIEFSTLFGMERFETALIEHEFKIDRNQYNANLKQGQWNKMRFFCEDEKVHRQQFAPVLDEIKKMEMKF
jgi:hypothetical protein